MAADRPAYKRVLRELTELLDRNPAEAVVRARKLPVDRAQWRQLRATILCDAGRVMGDVGAVDEATRIFSDLRERLPDNGGISYNLANALASRAQLDPAELPDWYLATGSVRREARALFAEAASKLEPTNPPLASQALTNLGHALDAAFRWIEAFDAYQQALEIYPQNGVASGSAAEMLLRVTSGVVLGHKRHLVDVARRLAYHAQTNRDTVARFAGPQAVATFDKLPAKASPLARTIGRAGRLGPYERFVTDNRLLLSPVLEGLGHNRRRWDDACIAQLSSAVSHGPKEPPVVAMFNVMKADYLVARDLLFRGSDANRKGRRETGLYFDTSDYALYGSRPSLLVLAQRAALDVLDKIAVALNEYLFVGEKVKAVYFHSLWREKPHAPRWKPALADAIQQGNPALVALSEIAVDLAEGADGDSMPGYLHGTKQARHAGTHRFVVLHDLSPGEPLPSPAIEHHMLDAFERTALRTVRLSRAALLHFLEVVTWSERARPDPGLALQMRLRPHR